MELHSFYGLKQKRARTALKTLRASDWVRLVVRGSEPLTCARFGLSKMRSEGRSVEVRVLAGDCRELLPTIEANSVQSCVTSPPYWGLRDYAHPSQIGAEPSPDQYVRSLLGVFREVRRVLKPSGTLWLNVGDGYARNGGTSNCGADVPGAIP